MKRYTPGGPTRWNWNARSRRSGAEYRVGRAGKKPPDPRSGMSSDIALEQQRRALLEQRTENERKEADTKAYALNAVLTPIKTIDWRTLMAINASKFDAKANSAMAFRELAENAEKIGQVNISPELLAGLLKPDEPTTPSGNPWECGSIRRSSSSRGRLSSRR